MIVFVDAIMAIVFGMIVIDLLLWIDIDGVSDLLYDTKWGQATVILTVSAGWFIGRSLAGA